MGTPSKSAWLALPLIVAACSVETKQPPKPPANQLSVTMPTLTIAPGDTFECVYTGTWTDKELSVGNIVGVQAKGGHHITVYWTDSTKSGHAPCTDEEMTSWHMVGGAESPTGGEPSIRLPANVAYKVPAGKQLVAQVHYINTTGASYPATDKFTLNLVDPATVTNYANLFSMFDPVFQLTPNANTTAVSTTTLTDDLQLLIMGGHMHELGQHYKLETFDAAGNPTVLYEKDWQPQYASHPPTNNYTTDAPLVLKKGTKIRQTCTWNNTTSNPVAFPREMCVMFGFYFPDKGDEVIIQGDHQP